MVFVMDFNAWVMRDMQTTDKILLVVTTINSIEEFTDDAIACEVKEENGDVKFEFAGDISSESKLLVESMLLGLRGVEQEYGKEFIVIED